MTPHAATPNLPPDLAAQLHAQAWPVPLLVTTDPDAIDTCQAYAVTAAPHALLVTLAHAQPPGLANLPGHTAIAALHAFTRHAALAWAPRRLRVNTLLRGPAAPLADILRTLAYLAASPSVTGQIIRLGL